MIKGLHHNAYRCRDSEETRGFYEDFLGLRFVSAFAIARGVPCTASLRWTTDRALRF
jgi:catechol 2,3-dioxygenase-like lactoylglutathione lyase family enzyme